MKKFVLKVASFIVAPVPYPGAAIWHIIIGSTLIWVVRGCPRAYSGKQFLTGLALSLVVGLVAYLVVDQLERRQS